MLNAIFKSTHEENGYEIEEIIRALCMDIPVALVLRLPRTYEDIGYTDILIYFPESSHIIIYDCNRYGYKYNIKKIIEIDDWQEESELIKKYQYAIQLSPFLQPNKEGTYSYFIPIATVGERILEIRLKYLDDDREKEWLEIWYYDDSKWRCKEPKQLGIWNYTKTTLNSKSVLNWINSEGESLKEGEEVPHINRYHEDREMYE